MMLACAVGEATCRDGIRNGDEIGLDCGGSCEPCCAGGLCCSATLRAAGADEGDPSTTAGPLVCSSAQGGSCFFDNPFVSNRTEVTVASTGTCCKASMHTADEVYETAMEVGETFSVTHAGVQLLRMDVVACDDHRDQLEGPGSTRRELTRWRSLG